MSAWKKVTANSNLIQTQSDRAVLIKLPKTDLMFWHPAKCVRMSGRGGYRMTISFTDEFSFKVFKNGKGKQSRFEKIFEDEIDASEFEAFFNE